MSVDEALQRESQQATLLGGFACLALVLAATGIYGVISYAVSLQRREIGVRMALGAEASDIVGWMARMGGIPVLAGLVIGFCATLALTRYLTSLLYGVTTLDPLTYLAVAGVMIAITLVAGMLPAPRFARRSPDGLA